MIQQINGKWVVFNDGATKRFGIHATKADAEAQELKVLGGPGSGHFGHSGRPGEIGGSSSEGGGGVEKKAGPARPTDPKEAIAQIESGRRVIVPPEIAEKTLVEMASHPKSLNLEFMQVGGMENRNLYSRHATDLKREEMPQVPAEHAKGFFTFLAERNVMLQMEEVDPRELMATQAEIDSQKVGQIYKVLVENNGQLKNEGPLLVANDKRVVDGHHRWAGKAAYAISRPLKMPIARLSVNIDKALELTLEYTDKVGIPRAKFGDKGKGAPGEIGGGSEKRAAAERKDEGFKPIVVSDPPPNAPPKPNENAVWINGQWIYIPTDTDDGIPPSLDLPEPPTKSDKKHRSMLESSSVRTLAKPEHPFTYCMEVIVPAMEREGKAPEDPEAFCGWWKHEHAQEHAESEHDESESRHLHLRSALGKAHTEVIEGKEFIIVPVIALMEGVIHAINAETPEFVPASAFVSNPEAWNGHPVVLEHPMKDGKQISATDAEIKASHGLGVIRNTRCVGKKLTMEAVIDVSKLKEMGQDKLITSLMAKEPIEVSVGAYVRVNGKSGMYNGKRYKAEWTEIFPDHLAFLPKGRGACSIEMGCGAHRAASYFVTAEAFVTESELKPRAACGCKATCGCKKGEGNMTRAELIATLVTDKYSGFREGDEPILEASSDARLEEFRSASDVHRDAERKISRLETENRNVAARAKVAEDKLRVAEQDPTEDEWLAKAPAWVKKILETRKAEEDAVRSSIISQLKELGSETEDQLKKKSTDDLKTLAKYARVQIPDFSGRIMAKDRQADEEQQINYAPPDPYAPHLAALRGK